MNFVFLLHPLRFYFRMLFPPQLYPASRFMTRGISRPSLMNLV